METYQAKFWKLKTGITRRCYRTNNKENGVHITEHYKTDDIMEYC